MHRLFTHAPVVGAHFTSDFQVTTRARQGQGRDSGFLELGSTFLFVCRSQQVLTEASPHPHPSHPRGLTRQHPFTHGHARSRTDLTIPNSAHQLTHTPDEKGHRVNSNDSARGLIVKGCSPWVREGNKPNEAEGKKNFAKRSVPSLKAKKNEK